MIFSSISCQNKSGHSGLEPASMAMNSNNHLINFYDNDNNISLSSFSSSSPTSIFSHLFSPSRSFLTEDSLALGDCEESIFFFSQAIKVPPFTWERRTRTDQHMPQGRLPIMELKAAYDIEHMSSTQRIQHEFWPLGPIDAKKAKFPCCLVWTPLPVVSWLAPFIGHVGICREDGTILDFAGSNFVNVDNFAFGAVARYFQLDREQCCFPPNLARHTCKHGYKHSEFGTAITWDDALQLSVRHFEHKSYNLFTCNCHSFVANCLNRLCYSGSMNWNMISVAALVLFKGHWVDAFSILRSFLPFIVVLSFGVFMVGWPFLIGLFSFSLLLLGWFLFGAYCVKSLLEC